MNLQAVILLVLKTSIVLSVFALGLKATFAEAICLFRRPRHLARAFLSMNVLMPLFALISALNLNLHPAVKIAPGQEQITNGPPLVFQTVAYLTLADTSQSSSSGSSSSTGSSDQPDSGMPNGGFNQ